MYGFSLINYTGLGLQSLYSIAIIIPTIAVGVRRFHDTGTSGWVPVTFGTITSITKVSLVLAVLFDINLLGSNIATFSTDRSVWVVFFVIALLILGIYYIIIACQSGQVGENQYGPDPINPDHINEIDLIGEE